MIQNKAQMKKLSFDYKNLKVAVFGLGVSGISALKLLLKHGADVEVYNKGAVSDWYSSQGLTDLVSMDKCFSDSELEMDKKIAENKLVILSPGIPRDHALLKEVHKKEIPVWAEIELGFEFCQVPVIAITGTNGKTTTTTLVGELIEAGGKKVFVGGNIGTPFCEYARLLPNVDVVLLELSSFQLESIVKFRPNTALFLNLFQNHGERYTSIEDYGNAKARMSLNMQPTDRLIYASDYPFIKNWAEKLNVVKIPVNTENLPQLFDPSLLRIPGHHNVINATFALLAIEDLELDKIKVLEALYQFKGVHHRIEYVENNWGFKAYDDAKSTNWDATITALKAVERSDKNVALILGGKKRGHGDSIAPYLKEIQSMTKEILLIGEMGKEIENELKVLGVEQKSFRYLENIENVVGKLKSEKFNGTLLFSPAFPSFDQFKNYEERGKAFQKALA